MTDKMTAEEYWRGFFELKFSTAHLSDLRVWGDKRADEAKAELLEELRTKPAEIWLREVEESILRALYSPLIRKPCLNCGYVPAIIHPAKAEGEEGNDKRAIDSKAGEGGKGNA